VETKSERPEPVVPHQVSGKHQCARCNPAHRKLTVLFRHLDWLKTVVFIDKFCWKKECLLGALFCELSVRWYPLSCRRTENSC